MRASSPRSRSPTPSPGSNVPRSFLMMAGLGVCPGDFAGAIAPSAGPAPSSSATTTTPTAGSPRRHRGVSGAVPTLRGASTGLWRRWRRATRRRAPRDEREADRCPLLRPAGHYPTRGENVGGSRLAIRMPLAFQITCGRPSLRCFAPCAWRPSRRRGRPSPRSPRPSAGATRWALSCRGGLQG